MVPHPSPVQAKGGGLIGGRELRRAVHYSLVDPSSTLAAQGWGTHAVVELLPQCGTILKMPQNVEGAARSP